MAYKLDKLSSSQVYELIDNISSDRQSDSDFEESENELNIDNGTILWMWVKVQLMKIIIP